MGSGAQHRRQQLIASSCVKRTLPTWPAEKQAPGTQGSFENFLDAQLTWDRAMAEALARRVASADSPQRPLVVGIMGSGHIRFGHGVAHQLRDLGVARVASLLPASTKRSAGACSRGSPVLFLLPEKPQPAPELLALA